MKAPALNGKRPVGRPSKRSRIIEDEICTRLAQGESLTSICDDDHMPCRDTIFAWLLNEEIDGEDRFSDRYARARQLQAEAMADDILAIADDGRNDTYEDKDGNVLTDNDVIQRSRLRVDTRKFLMAKLLPKKYGDRPEQNINVSTVVHNHISAAQQQEYHARMQKALGGK